MKNVLLAISLLCSIQSLTVLGMDPPPPSEFEQPDIVIVPASPVTPTRASKRQPTLVPPVPPIKFPKNPPQPASPPQIRVSKNPLQPASPPSTRVPKIKKLEENSLSRSSSPYTSPRATPGNTPRDNLSSYAKSTQSGSNPSLSGSNISLNSSNSSLYGSNSSTKSLNSSTDSLGRSPRREKINVAGKCPAELKHKGIIPDGHRRASDVVNRPFNCAYARSAYVIMPRLTKAAFKAGLETLTIWLFSPQNWGRDRNEIDCLMTHFYGLTEELLELAHNYEVKIIHLGRKSQITEKYGYLAEILVKAEEATKDYTGHELCLAIDYGGQDEIEDALLKIGNEKPDFNFEQITKKDIQENLPTAVLKNPVPQLAMRSNSQVKTSGLWTWHTQDFLLYPAVMYATDLSTKELLDSFTFFSEGMKSSSKVSFDDYSESSGEDREPLKLVCPEGLKHLHIISDTARKIKAKAVLKTFNAGALTNDPLLIKQIYEIGIETLTLSLFSPDDWKLRKTKIDILMDHFSDMIDALLPIARAFKVKINHLGNKDVLLAKYPSLFEKLRLAEEETKDNTKHELNLGIDYGGQDDIVHAIRKVAVENRDADLKIFSKDRIAKNLQVAILKNPAPDLVIGQANNPGVISWYAQRFIIFPAPEVNLKALVDAIHSFSERERLNGK